MGLDMSLSAKWFVPFGKGKVKVTGLKEVTEKNIQHIAIEVIYWRKANAIHAWFVKHVQDGNDDCEEYLVNREDIALLLNDLKSVLGSRKNIGPSKQALSKLPTKSGFFFGGTEYDEYYWEELERTKVELEKCLKMDSNWTFYYSSSW